MGPNGNSHCFPSLILLSSSAFLRDGIYSCVRPEEFIDTNWADHNGDGVADFPHSMLDYTFVTGPATKWNVTSKVMVAEGDFPDDKTTSDHRPVMTVVGG